MTSPKKAEHFSALAPAFAAAKAGELKVIHKVKGDDNYGANFKELLSLCSGDASTTTKIGTFLKAAPEGGFATAWTEALTAAPSTEVVDISSAFNIATAVKEPAEQDSVKTASVLAAKIMSKMKADFLECIDTGSELKHSALSDKYNNILESPFDALSLSREHLREEDFESCYAPTVQSGGKYDTTRLGAESNDANIEGDVLIASFGARYKGYCAHITRTYFINPTEQARRIYTVLTEIQSVIMKAPGLALSSAACTRRLSIMSKMRRLTSNSTFASHLGSALALGCATHLMSFRTSAHAKWLRT